MSVESIWDTIVIGAGPAGLMAAITVARKQKRALVLDGEARSGKKLLITGGGHCNISNREVSENDYQSGQPRAVRNILRSFTPDMTRQFFSGIGIEIVEDEDGKLFPEARTASSVLEALLGAMREAGVSSENLRKVTRVESHGGRFLVSGAGFSYETRTVILATGGLSYPETGSDGSGYALARSFGHKIVPTAPALTPLRIDDPEWNSLTGITLPAEFSLTVNGKKMAVSKGPLLFTHTGLSGPGVLDLSRHWIRLDDKKNAKILVNFLPRYTKERFLDEITKAIGEQPALSLKKALARYFPERLAEVLVSKSGLDPLKQLAHWSKQDRQILARAVFSLPVGVSGAFGFEKAEATAGGVDMNEVDPKTLESKKHPGLFFTGEMLDVDGRIGGFNLHWAWASGRIAGESVIKKLTRLPR